MVSPPLKASRSADRVVKPEKRKKPHIAQEDPRRGKHPPVDGPTRPVCLCHDRRPVSSRFLVVGLGLSLLLQTFLLSMDLLDLLRCLRWT